MLSFDLSSHARSSRPSTTCRFVPDLTKLNYSELAEHLFNTDFSDCMLSYDANANHIWDCLSSAIRVAINTLALMVKKVSCEQLYLQER